MRSPIRFRLLLLMVVACASVVPGGNTRAESLKGVVTVTGGFRGIGDASVVLYDLSDKNNGPKVALTDDQGRFSFDLGDSQRLYRLEVHYEGVSRYQETFVFNGQKPKEKLIPLTSYGSWLWGKFWDLLVYLLSFVAGLFSREVMEFVNRRKTQHNIAHVYNNSIREFLDGVRGNTPLDPTAYAGLKEKLTFARENLKSLLSYSWAAEKVQPDFFEELQKKMYCLYEMEKEPAFKEDISVDRRCEFLNRHKNEQDWPPDKRAHEHFEARLGELALGMADTK